MAVVSETLGGARQGSEESVAFEPRKTRPVMWWAVIGVIALAVQIYAYTGWFVSGDATNVPDGPTPIPTHMRVGAIGLTIIGFFVLGISLWFFLIRPWIRERRLTADGMLCIAFASLTWQDELPNIFSHVQTYNTVFWNLGGWYDHVPGWLSPDGRLIAEPILWVFPTYVYCILPFVAFGCFLMRKGRERWPEASNFRLIATLFAIYAAVDMILEPLLFLPWGVWSYAGTIEWLTIFQGHYYQFPLYEAVLWPGFWTMLTCLRYFKDDKGLTIVERGIDSVRLSQKGKTGLRTLALVGICNFLFLFAYNLPHSIIGLWQSPWPKDVTSRSYFPGGRCGPNTSYACPGPAIPFPRPDSAYITPEGTLVRK